jgi:hypothetical protein
MGLVVGVRWASLAAGAEVGIVAYSTLVSVTLDISLEVVALVAKRTVTVDANVTSLAAIGTRNGRKIVEWLVNRDEAVAWVDEVGIWHADRAEIPIGAIEALMSDTIDVFITAIADCIVASVATWSKESLHN